MKRLIGVLPVIIVTLSIVCFANDRNRVISTINSNYYTDDMSKVVESISKIDATMSDEQYLKSVFECLDEYSVYYTKEEYTSQVVTESSGMISALLYKNDIVVEINRFGNGVETTFSEYMKKCRENGIKKMTLDLTECPGGYVHVMNSIANEIVPEGRIMIAKFKNSEQEYFSELEKCPFEEITVKVSSKTASAAEILAAALQESGVATVVGVNTYGKTSIQSFHMLESGAAFKLTCGEYLTGSGNDISKTGVVPDIVDYSYPVKIRWNNYCKDVFRKNEAVSE